MPPKQPTRRQRVEEGAEEFCDLPSVSLARFTAPQTHTITLPIELPAAQLGAQATYSTVAAKLLFQPARNFGIIVPGEVEATTAAAPTQKTGNKKNKDDANEDNNEDEDEQNVDNLLAGLHSANAAAGHNGTTIGRKSTIAPNLLPRRIICGIVQVADVQPVGTKTSVRGGDLFKLNVHVTVQTVRVLSDGFCSAMVCRQQGNSNEKKADQNSPATSAIEKNSALGVKISFFVSKEFSSSSTKKAQNNKSNDENKEDEEASEFFTATVPLDAAHLLAAATSENKFGGKKVLVSVENSGISWRAHLGLTPGNGSGGKSQSGGKWETHMPWSRSEKKTAWNFRAPPPSQRTNEDRIVIKFVKDPMASGK